MIYTSHLILIGRSVTEHQMGDACRTYTQIFLGNPEGKRLLRRARHRWEVMRMDQKQVVNWINLAQDKDRGRAVTKAVMNFGIPQNAGKILTS
jgi:hypothetical protein